MGCVGVLKEKLIIVHANMKTKKILTKSAAAVLSSAFILSGFSGCSTWNSMSQSGQGAAAGGAIGAAVGTGVGALIGGGRGTWIGALVGSALGAGAGALVGNSMEKQKKALEEQLNQLKAQQDANRQDIDKNSEDIARNAEAINDIKVEMVKDSNNLDAIKLVMGDAVLFNTNSYALSAGADAMLSRIAYNLKQFPKTDVTVVGFTDNTGAEAYNQKLSLQRAQSVAAYLESQGIPASRLKTIGEGENNPIASNATPAGRAQNRRVEMYITADSEMIQDAQQAAN